MNLKSLVGEHKFSGFEYGDEKYKDDCGEINEREYCLFILDGVTYLASEDPEDGYRSSCDDLEITDREVKNRFKPISVVCTVRGNDDYSFNDVLEIYDKITNKLILAIGTNCEDDCYPVFVGQYYPQNMSVNQ